MSMNSLKDVYHDQLQDLYSACKQSLSVVGELAEAATHEELEKALKDGSVGISEGMEEISKLCNDHGINPDGEFCKGMEGLVKEARAHGLEEDFGDSDARDAMIITQYQRMAHYAIAGYGCLRAFANRLDLDGDAAVLSKCLDNSYDGDRRFTEIATGEVNKAAA
ncbi:MAG: ferritin-like domain-containing protein [Shimia sp.]